MAEAADIANITHHQAITDAMLTSMGECMALQQALMHVPNFNGKNMPLKSFIEDVENGYTFVPEGLKTSFFKGVCSKLKETARDAVADKTIESIEDLSKALKEYFSPKKSYPYYCAEIQSVRLRRDESVLDYYTRIKRLRTSAIAALKDKFTNEEANQMLPMLDGVALESFKRGLSDDLLYAISVQDPQNLEDALKVVQRIERDMQGANARNSNSLRYTHIEKNPASFNNDNLPRRVSFHDRDHNFDNRNQNFNKMFRRDTTPPREHRQTHENFPTRRFPNKNPPQRNFYGYQPNNYYGSPFYPPQPYGPPMYPPMYHAYNSYPQNFYPSYPMQQSSFGKYERNTRPVSPKPNNISEHLNSEDARRTDASTSDSQNQRLSTVKFLTAGNLLDGQVEQPVPQ